MSVCVLNTNTGCVHGCSFVVIEVIEPSQCVDVCVSRKAQNAVDRLQMKLSALLEKI